MRLTAIAAVALFAFGAPAAHAITADELVAKNIEARGGLDALKKIESVRTTGKLVFTGDFAIELASSDLVTREGKVRSEATLQGLTGVQAYDGSEAWQIAPFQGRKDPMKMSSDDAMGLKDTADIDGPLVGWKEKGHKLSYLGTEDVDGTNAHKLLLTEKDGDVKTVFLDPDYFLEIRQTVRRKVRGVEQEYEVDLGNYEKVEGVYFPYSLEIGPKGGNKNQKVVVEKVEVNVEVDPAQFSFPATAQTTGAAK